MTIAISVKVHDGVVLAADSASSLVDQNGLIVNVYNNANKIFNLYKGLPVGSMTWGAGSIGHASISTLSKDLRRRFTGQDVPHGDWALIHDNYTLADVAAYAREFLYDEMYTPAYGQAPQKPSLGYLIAGYSSGRDLPETWRIVIDENGNSPPPELQQPEDATGIFWSGMPEAVQRLVFGYGQALPDVLRELGVPKAQVDPAMAHITARLQASLVHPAMPIQDAIDLASYLVEASILFYRFFPGAPCVGGPIEVAAITKHEGFKWIARKHYFDIKYNLDQ